MKHIFRVLRSYLMRFCRLFFVDNDKRVDMHSYAECRKVIENELELYSEYFGVRVRQSKLSGNVWRIYVDGFYQAFIFYTRIVGQRAYVTSKCADNYRYSCKIDNHTTLLLTDKIRRDSTEVANLYLSDSKNHNNKRVQIRFIRKSTKTEVK